MSKTSTYDMPFKRRGAGRTNYVKRLAMLKSEAPRAVIRKSTNHMMVQFVKSEAGKDKVVAAGFTKELNEFKYAGHGGNIPAAYLAGYLAGKRYAKGNKESVIVDFGVQTKVLGSRLFAAVKGLQDAGVDVKVDADALPKEDRVMGKHIENFAKHASSKTNRHQFTSYSKAKIDPSTMSKLVEDAKKNINESVKA